MGDLRMHAYDAARSILLILSVILSSVLIDSLAPLPAYIAIILIAILFPVRHIESKHLYWILGVGVLVTGIVFYLFDDSMLGMIVFGVVSAMLFVIPEEINK